MKFSFFFEGEDKFLIILLHELIYEAIKKLIIIPSHEKAQ